MRCKEGQQSFLRWLPILTVVAAPCAIANGITALSYASLIHLIFGNAFIGVGEGILLALVFRASWLRAIPLMTVANYLSAWAGFILLSVTGENIVEAMLPADPTAALALMSKWLWATALVPVVAMYLLTILMEWPVVFLALGKRPRRGFVALMASVLLQTLSYAILIPYYWNASTTTLFTQTTIDPVVVSGTADNAWVYFLSDERNALCRIRIDGTELEKVKKLEDSRRWTGLRMTQVKPESRWNLVATATDDQYLILVPEFSAPDSFVWEQPFAFPDERRLPEPMKGDWNVSKNWASLKAYNRTENKYLWLCIETPYVRWGVAYSTPLPDGRVVFQLGPRIVLLDPDTARLGGLAVGRCPTVVLDVAESD